MIGVGADCGLDYSTNYLGIACFTVRHKDNTGHWVENDQAKEERQKKD
jgi:hypothetical protein